MEVVSRVVLLMFASFPVAISICARLLVPLSRPLTYLHLLPIAGPLCCPTANQLLKTQHVSTVLDNEGRLGQMAQQFTKETRSI